MKGDELVKYRFEDAKTLYQCFQRGKRESSEFSAQSLMCLKLLSFEKLIVGGVFTSVMA